MSEIKFKLKEMVGFDWNLLDDDQREEVIENIFKSPFVGVIPDKYLRVGSLKGRTIPEDFKIFNPDFEKDSIHRAILNDEFTHIDELSTSANEGGGLQKSKISEIALNTGDPREMEYIEQGKEKLIMKDKVGPSISLDIDIESPKTREIRREIEKNERLHKYKSRGEKSGRLRSNH